MAKNTRTSIYEQTKIQCKNIKPQQSSQKNSSEHANVKGLITDRLK